MKQNTYQWSPNRNSQNMRMQAEIREWVDISKWNNPIAITLTLKPSIWSLTDRGGYFVGLTRQHACNNQRYFRKLLNTALFGNNFKRRGEQLKIFSVLEGAGTKPLHYHCAVDCPPWVSEAQFMAMAQAAWQKTDWGNLQVKVVFSANNGWINYCTKWKSELSVTDSIDWENTYL